MQDTPHPARIALRAPLATLSHKGEGKYIVTALLTFVPDMVTYCPSRS